VLPGRPTVHFCIAVWSVKEAHRLVYQMQRDLGWTLVQVLAEGAVMAATPSPQQHKGNTAAASAI